MQNILVVDDDDRIARLLGDYLCDAGFSAATAVNAEDFWTKFKQQSFDLIVLDLGLPDQDGLTIVRNIRKTSSVPIVIVSGQDDVVDRVAGLEVGADDYITKPFHMREVLARIRAVLRRRAEPTKPAGKNDGDTVLTFADWQLDLARRELTCPKGRLIDLTTGEFDILQALAERAQRVLSRDQLMDLVRGANWTPYDRSVDTMIGRLRKKLAVGCDAHALIKTVRGAGYMMTASARMRRTDDILKQKAP